MTERGFDTGFWTNPDIVPLPTEAKTLYIYLWTNAHCNQAGLYEISLETVAFETRLSKDGLPKLFSLIESKVKWYPEQNLVWVKNFIKRQSRSSKFLIAAANSLKNIHLNGAITELIQYNAEKYNISIPYQYPTSSISIPPYAGAGASAISLSNKGGGREEDLENAKISKLYEENIGQITPVVAENLKHIRDQFSAQWFEAALKESVKSNARNLKYITAILERWKTEGFESPQKGGFNGREPKGTRNGTDRRFVKGSAQSTGRTTGWTADELRAGLKPK
ncbi:MAG: DnaD domain protein [Candidatus Zixiibacteriota bacterium]